MALYSDLRPRRTRQVVGDVAVVLWFVFWVWQGWSVHQSISTATTATERAQSASVSLGENLEFASDTLSAIPLLGDTVASPFRSAADAADRMASASQLGTETVEELAWKLGVGTALTPNILLLVAWLPRRLAQVRRSSPEWARQPELLALRALMTQPPAVLGALAADPVGGVLNRDPVTIRALADHQMAHDGIRAPQDHRSNRDGSNRIDTGPTGSDAGSEGSGQPPAAAPEAPEHG
ncbi:hypothetical protein [Nocardioides alcanivorans]|uniref:hypothetical protein n=1 Tax=Nocardioides alcanivorans TaxID=2897352 RepID=UPI001F3F542A|nr:hypothetical protein [Nocardioides alcanivorans]